MERGLPNVTVNHARFHTTNFQYIELYGLINFNHCLFDGNSSLYIFIQRSKYEAAPPTEYMRWFKYHIAKQQIKFYKSQFHVRRLTIDPSRESLRESTFIDCESYTNYLFVRVLFTETLFSLQFHRTVLSIPDILIEAQTAKAYFFINMSNLILSNVALNSFGHFKGYLGLHLDNITWVNNNKGFMDLHNVICVNIVSCVLILNCGTCPQIMIVGISIRRNSLEYYFLIDISHHPSTIYFFHCLHSDNHIWNRC